MTQSMTRAVILARGLGTRMRRQAEGATVDARQASVADTGVKAMIPIGRPFLDYVLSALADAGYEEACLVIGPEHHQVRDYYTHQVKPSRLRVHFAIQPEPLGTANAVLAAEAFVEGQPFLAINSDNYYPLDALRAVRAIDSAGLAGFERDALVAQGNIDDERVSKYAVLQVDEDGYLAGILEKPDRDTWARVGPRALISMNCWRFGPAIFEAGRRIDKSARGEYEIADAVAWAMRELGERFRVVPVRAGVLDLSTRGDIASVAARLSNVEVRI